MNVKARPDGVRGENKDMTKRFLALAAIIAALPLSACITIPPAYGPAAGACAAQTADPAAAKDPVYFVATGMPDCVADTPLSLSVLRGSFRPYGEAPPDPVRYGVATQGAPTLPVLALSSATAWQDRLRRDLQAAGNGGKGRVLLYVHGYNTTPSHALSMADQVAMAARFEGPVVAFLWPSQHTLTKYGWDEENARWTQPSFDKALADLARIAPDVVLVSHSMGGRIAIDGLRHLQASAPDLAARVRTVVLAAPDMDRELFDRDVSPDIVRPGRRVALFASGHDLALRSSWAVHGNPRAGDVGCVFRLQRRRGPAIAQPRCYPVPRGAAGELTVIDGTDIPGTPIGHSTYVATPEGRAALRKLLAPGAVPLPADKGVMLLHLDSPPDCANGPSRLRMDYTVVRCTEKKKR